MDLVRLFDACLHSLWLLPVLAVMIAADGPVPVLPSETILMSAAAAAFGIHDVRGTVGLFAAALVGSIAGDLLAFWLGRSSNRLLPAAAHADCGLGHWVRANLFHRPVVALVGARLLPRRPPREHRRRRPRRPAAAPLPARLAGEFRGVERVHARRRHAPGPDGRRQPVPEPRRGRRHGGAHRGWLRGDPAAAGPPPAGDAGRGSPARSLPPAVGPAARPALVTPEGLRYRFGRAARGTRRCRREPPDTSTGAGGGSRSTGTGQSLNARERRWL